MPVGREHAAVDVAEARAVLGLQPSASWPEVRAAYLQLVRAHHPDAAEDLADVGLRTLRTALITRAYAVLLSERRSGTTPPAAPPRQGPQVTRARWPDTRAVLLDAGLEDAFQAMLEVAHLVGSVSYVDRESTILEVIVAGGPSEATSLLVDLEPVGDRTEAVLGVEPLGRHPPVALDELVTRIAALLAAPRPPPPGRAR